MKICFVVQDLSLGGSNTVVHDIIRNWNSSDELFLVSFFNNFDKRYEDLKTLTNLQIIFLGKKRTIDIPFLFKLKKCLINIKPDVISSHLTTTFYLKLVGLDRKCSIFHTIHSEPSCDLPKIYRLFLKKSIIKNKIKLIGCCEYISNKAKELYGVDVITINNGIQINEECNTIDVNKPVKFLFVGRFETVKNIDLLIESFNSTKNNNSELYLCGFGTLEEHIKQLIDNSIKKNFIFLLGKSNSVDDIYKKCDVLCLVSKREGLPMTILEAISYNMAFITSNVGGISSFVHNELNGYCIDNITCNKIAEKMDELVFNKTKITKFKTYSHNTKNKILASTMAEKYRSVLK